MSLGHDSSDAFSRHDLAVTQTEIRRIVLALAPYGVLHRDALRSACGADRWHEGSFAQALAAAVKSGAIEQLPGDFYREPR